MQITKKNDAYIQEEDVLFSYGILIRFFETAD